MNKKTAFNLSPQHSQLMSIVVQRQLTEPERTAQRELVFAHVIRNSRHISSGNFVSLSNEDLGILFHAIDENYFEGKISTLCEQTADRPLAFRLSTRMTSSGGMTTMKQSRGLNPKKEFEIAVATTPLFETFKLDTAAMVGGVNCHNRLEALQRIMEHEMIHLVEMLLWNGSNCSAARFREIVRRFFGHLESNHRLLTPRDVAKKKLGITTGDSVSFEMEGQRLTGVVNRISKRATVLVAHPQGTRYTDGKRYLKFYVPLARLRRV